MGDITTIERTEFPVINQYQMFYFEIISALHQDIFITFKITDIMAMKQIYNNLDPLSIVTQKAEKGFYSPENNII